MRVASFRERLLAASVDAAVAILGMAVVVGLSIGGAVLYVRVRGGDDEDEADRDEHGDGADVSATGFRGDGDGLEAEDPRSCGIQHRPHGLLQSPGVGAALQGASDGLAVAGRNWRSPGFRAVGLRRLDARTGGSISVRSAVSGLSFNQTRQAVTTPLLRSRAFRERDRSSELAPAVKEIQRKHATDPQARQHAITEFYKAHAVHPLAGCAWPVAGPILSQLILAIAIRDGRTVYDRLTGTMVVADR